MSLYFFHLRDGGTRLLDPLGRRVEDPAKLEEMALSEARALIAQDALNGEINLDQRIEVEDEAGNIVERTPFRHAISIRGLEQAGSG